MKRIAPFLIIIAVLGAALGSAWYLTKPGSTSTNSTPTASPNQTTPATASQSPKNTQLGAVRTGIPGAEPAHTKGPASAPAQIEEFGDFQCPPCGAFHPVLEQMEEEFGDKLRVTFRQYPLPNHTHALRAASAAEAAGLQGKFWEMHKLIYDHQKEWKDLFDVRAVFDDYAKQIGLDVERFNRDLGGGEVAQRVIQDGKRGQSMGVTGTPTVFLNGREVPFEMLAPDKIRVLIQNQILSAGSK